MIHLKKEYLGMKTRSLSLGEQDGNMTGSPYITLPRQILMVMNWNMKVVSASFTVAIPGHVRRLKDGLARLTR